MEMYRPLIPVLDTQEMISHMPEGHWQIPSEPYTALDRIRENDHPLMKDHKIESFQEYCRETVAYWIPFFDKAEKGYRLVLKTIREFIVTADVESISSFNYLYPLLKPRFEGGEDFDFPEMLASVRRAFLHLLTDKQAEELGHQKPSVVSEEDIQNARYLVDKIETYG